MTRADLWAEISVAEALEALASPQCSTRLRVFSTSGAEGEVCLQEGQLVHASFGPLEGEFALMAMLSQPFAQFSPEKLDEGIPVPQTLECRSVNDLLLRWKQWEEPLFLGGEMNPKILEILEKMTADTNGGITNSDVFDRTHGMSIAGVNSSPRGCALFNGLAEQLSQTIAKTNGLMEEHDMLLTVGKGGGAVAIVELTPKHRLGIKADTNKCSLGLLLSVALPDAIASLRAALA